MKIKKNTEIQGATDIQFDNGLRIWCPPPTSFKPPYFTQPAIVTKSQKAELPAGIPCTENPYAHFKPRELTHNEQVILSKTIIGSSKATKKSG